MPAHSGFTLYLLLLLLLHKALTLLKYILKYNWLPDVFEYPIK